MSKVIIKTSLILFFAAFVTFTAQIAGGRTFDFSAWDDMLEKYCHEGTKEMINLTLINYPLIKKDPGFYSLIKRLESFPINSLKTKDEKLAFWINTYNILAVKLILDHYPISSVKNIGNWFNRVWDEKVGIIGGKAYSLNDIEHGILRKMEEPRIHIAIVCASISCPDIAMESYSPQSISSQLDSQTRQFMANETKGFLIYNTEALVYISSIFNWFQKDFQGKKGVIQFIKTYAPENKKKYLKYLESGDFSLRYIDFNWNLNGPVDLN